MTKDQMAELELQLEQSRGVEPRLVRALLEENERLQRDTKQMVSGFRSRLCDLITRIGPARRPEDIKSNLEEIYNAYNVWGDKSAEAARDKLQRFKDYVHARLDAAGVTVDPESSHKAEGCRIGGRLDEVFQVRAELLGVLEEYLVWLPAFRATPVGSPGSEAREEQQALIDRFHRLD
jgi:hypothetical protein